MKHEEELLVNDFKTVDVQFNKSTTLYTYKMHNSMQAKEGDFAIVDTVSGFTVVEIMEVHDEVKIDFNSNFEYKYIVQVVDTTRYEELQVRSDKIRQVTTEAKRRTLRKSLAAEFADGLTDDAVKALETDCGIKVERL